MSDTSNAEDNIFTNHIEPALAEDGNESTTTTTSESAAPAPAETTPEPGVSGAGKDRGTQPAATPAGAKVPGQAPDPNQPPKTKRDDKGNVVDEQGNVVAAAGSARRYYEELQRVRKYTSGIEKDLQTARSEAAQTTALNGLPKQLGLNNQQVTVALQVGAEFAKDPVKTLKYLLTEARKLGHNVDTLLGAQGGVDMGAIRSMIDEAVGPIKQNREHQEHQRQAEEAATREYNAFMANPEFENAHVHEGAIARLMEHDPQLSMQAAYYKLQAVSFKHGLDFSQPLGPQIQARKQGASQPSATVAGQDRGPGLPGRSGNAPVTDQPYSAKATDSWDDIIRAGFKDAGRNVDV